MKRQTVHHLIRRESRPGSSTSIDGIPLMSVTDLREGHSPAKMRRSKRNGEVEGSGPVYREPREGMMVEKRPLAQRA